MKIAIAYAAATACVITIACMFGGADECADGTVQHAVKAGGMTIKTICVEDLEGVE